MITIIGAGLSGLTAGYVLAKANQPCRIFEREPFIGGLARTVAFRDYLFDLGGHRFYTKLPDVQEFVEELLGEDLIAVNRSSSIYLRGRLIAYPLRALNAMLSLGLVDSAHVGWDYLIEKLSQLGRELPPERNFEEWAVRRFGRRLYEIYFKTYSEKVWGVPCPELSPDFADQRIRGLSFSEAVKNALFRRKPKATTLIARFFYPKRGFGMIPDALAARLPEGTVVTSSEVVKVSHSGDRITSIDAATPEGIIGHKVTNLISSIPLTTFVRLLEPPPPKEVMEAAAQLRYRDMVIVFLGINKPQVSADHWRYFPSEDVPFARFHEPKNWSALMAPPERTSLVVEYFANRGDDCWNMADRVIVDLTVRHLERLGLMTAGELESSLVLRLSHVYPLYTVGYRAHAERVLEYLGGFSNLQCIGRPARFLYTSSDHYILMGIKAAHNILGANHDLSSIGTEKKYAEEG